MKFKKIISKLLVTFFFLLPAKAEFDIKVSTAILQDYLSGEILYEKDPDQKIYPASMTKIMTTIIAFDLIKKGDLSLDDKFLVTENAWRLSKSGYSSMFIMVGDEVSVENLLKGIIVASGNDACVALAEGIAGSEDQFAIMMTAKAKEIGMTNTNFSNSSGIDHINNYSTVRDILIMSNYLIRNFPENYRYYAEKEFTWDRTGGDPIKQGNRNPLLYKNIGADGIKTGHLAVAKYSLAASIFKNNRRFISVGSGFETKNSRSKQSLKLLIWALTNFDTIKIAKSNEKFDSLFVRIDILERLFVQIINSSLKGKNEIMLVPEMLNLLGCSEDNFVKLIKTMNYKSYQKENKLYFKYFPVKKKIFRNNKENINKDNPFNILKEFNIK